jgi:hypothetical protein
LFVFSWVIVLSGCLIFGITVYLLCFSAGFTLFSCFCNIYILGVFPSVVHSSVWHSHSYVRFDAHVGLVVCVCHAFLCSAPSISTF